MDSEHFDALTRALTSRRTALGGLLGGGFAALLGLTLPEEASAHNLLPGCRKIKDLAKRRACLRRAQRHNRLRHCRPQPTTVTCAGRCGTWPNNCNKSVTCRACAPKLDCLNNGSCGRICTIPSAPCPNGCYCSNFTVEGPQHCILAPPCSDMPQTCASTTECPLGQQCQHTVCGPGGSLSNRCVPLCPL